MADTHRDEIEKLEALYASNPAGRVFTHLAEAYRKAGDFGLAREILATGLERHPEYPSAYVVLGRVLLGLGEREEAVSAFRKVLELDRHNLIALRNLGDIAVEEGRFAEARHYFEELIQVDPGDLETAERLGTLPEEEPQAFEPAWGELTEPEAEPEFEGMGAGAGDTSAAPESGESPEWANGRFAGEPAGLERWGDGFESGLAPVEEEPPPEEGALAEAGDTKDTGARGGQPSPLDAWVESLNVLGVEPELPEYPATGGESEAGPGEMEAAAEDLPAAAGPDAEAEGSRTEASWLAASAPEPGIEAGGAQPETGSDELADVVLEAEAEALFPGPGPVGAESRDLVAGISFFEETTGAEREAEPPGDLAERGPGAGPEPQGEPLPAEAGSEDEARGSTVEAELESAWWGDPEIHGTVPDPVEWVSQEDWERIAAYGAWTGADAGEGVAPGPELEAEWGESGPDEDADEVATETLAEVYAAQGFRAEAAEIYRKLLRRRPEDPRLLSRLAALEGERPGPVEDAGFEAGEEALGEVWIEPAEPAWPGADELVVAGPTPYAWVEAAGAPEAEEGETIGHRLRGLLAWRPESAPESEPTLLLEEVAAEPPEPDYSGPAPSPAGLTETVRPAGERGDDDLEMFRSWLKSLRK